jgi:methylenetetrahydrofolate--tRNA-(uracil-5-)-methyltransferase
LIKGEEMVQFPIETAIGSQAYYIANCPIEEFQPMNTNFGIFPDLGFKHKKNMRKQLYVERALEKLKEFIEDGKIE